MNTKNNQQPQYPRDAQAPKDAAPAAPDEEIEDVIPDEEGEEIEQEKELLNDDMAKIQQLTSQLQDAQARVDKEKNEYLYLMAEFDNFRKRTVKEKADIIKTASEKALKDLLPIVDDFERAIEANASPTVDIETVKAGVELIYQKLVKYLESNGVKAIDSTGKEFDADLHEAIAMVPTDDEASKGRVIDTVTKGYTLGDKVIRHAKVAVAQ